MSESHVHKIFFKSDDKIKISGKQKLREFLSSGFAKIIEEISQAEKIILDEHPDLYKNEGWKEGETGAYLLAYLNKSQHL